MTVKAPKRPRDTNELAKSVVDIATGRADEVVLAQAAHGKDPAAVSLGRKGGLKGGKARAQSLTPERRKEIARRAATARWSDKDDG